MLVKHKINYFIKICKTLKKYVYWAGAYSGATDDLEHARLQAVKYKTSVYIRADENYREPIESKEEIYDSFGEEV